MTRRALRFKFDSAAGGCPHRGVVLPVIRSHALTAAPAKPARLHYLQCLRGLAALTVVLSHFPHWGNPFPGSLQIYDAGSVAVFVFFAISGYIIAYSHRGETGWRAAGGYVAKRALRLLPAYLVFSAAAFTLHTAGWISWDTYVTKPRGALGLLTALTLLPLRGAGSLSFLAVGWSLFYEVSFYFLFAAFFFGRRVGTAVIALAAAAVIANEAVRPIPGVWMSWMSLLLFAGCALGLYRGRVPLARRMFVFLGASGLGFLVTAILHPLRPESQPCAFVGAALVTLCAIGLDQTAPAPARGWLHRALHELGNMSYSLYLSHTVVHTVLYHFMGRPRLAGGVGVAYAVAPLIVAWASYRWIERPAQALGRVIAGVGSPQPAAALVARPTAVAAVPR